MQMLPQSASFRRSYAPYPKIPMHNRQRYQQAEAGEPDVSCHLLFPKEKLCLRGDRLSTRSQPRHQSKRETVPPCSSEAKNTSQPHLPAREILHDLLAAASDRVDLDLAVDPLDPDAAHK